MLKKKKPLGFDTKLRARAVINQEYTNVAAEYGHKAFQLKQLGAQLVRTEQDLEAIQAKMAALNVEQAAPEPDPTEPVGDAK